MKRFLILLIPAIIFLVTTISTTLAQENPNPTPVVIDLSSTPVSPPSPTPGSGTATPLPGTLALDRFEANNTAEAATQIGFQVEQALTLTSGDVDFFTGYAKAGQLVMVQTAVYDGLDTELMLYWNGALLAHNDDRSGVDLGSQVAFQAPADGWYTLKVQSVAGFTGVYDLIISLTVPTPTLTLVPTHTPLPTMTPMPTATPLVPPDMAEPNNRREQPYGIVPDTSYSLSLGQGDIDYFSFIGKAGNTYACETITPQIDTLFNVLVGGALVASNDDRSPQRVDSFVTWEMAGEQLVILEVQSRNGAVGSYELVCTPQAAAPIGADGYGAVAPVVVATAVLTNTETLTATNAITQTGLPLGAMPLQILPLGPEIPPEPTVQQIQLVVYYDSNNDQEPSPGEGIPTVSVLAVDANGQHLARVFTNAGGEAIFNTTDNRIDRLVVPFVSDWSVRVKPGQPESLGLPAVQIPVFLPVAKTEDSE
jgi:hypothetical protein